MLVQPLFQNLIYNEPLMRQTMHYFPHLHMHITIVGDFFMYIVFLDKIFQ